ncbi:MAG: hypothetical protein MUC62_04270 [Candidatus Thermoplasmatota archaeon]|jgi:hypothetical protein|nr:hypothetical protein [Candidatus Thermoplasmatota archaeon]
MAPSERKKPGYRVPRADKVREIIAEVMKDAMTVRSQTRLHDLVMERLRTRNEERVKLSQKRLRRIAAGMEGLELIILCRDGDRRDHRTNCPVCGTRMDDIKNSTLYGWTVSTGKLCALCHYWTGSRERIPIRYVFTIDRERYLKDRKEAL